MSWMRFAPKEWTKAHRKFCFGQGGLASYGIPFKTEVYITVNGFTFKIDVQVSPNIIVEIDGFSHDKPRRQEKDSWKDALLTEDGFKVFRFSDWQINHEFEACVNQVKEAYNAI